MQIDDYLGNVVVLELDTTETLEGVFEKVDDQEITDCYKITNGSEVWLITRSVIAKITPVTPIGFKVN